MRLTHKHSNARFRIHSDSRAQARSADIFETSHRFHLFTRQQRNVLRLIVCLRYLWYFWQWPVNDAHRLNVLLSYCYCYLYLSVDPQNFPPRPKHLVRLPSVCEYKHVYSFRYWSIFQHEWIIIAIFRLITISNGMSSAIIIIFVRINLFQLHAHCCYCYYSYYICWDVVQRWLSLNFFRLIPTESTHAVSSIETK